MHTVVGTECTACLIARCAAPTRAPLPSGITRLIRARAPCLWGTRPSRTSCKTLGACCGLRAEQEAACAACRRHGREWPSGLLPEAISATLSRPDL
eukprot:scaffold56809_cov62-Phaeocystis_antarctica.AAC.1